MFNLDIDIIKNNINDFLPKFLISIFIFILFLSLAIYTKNLILDMGTHQTLDTKSESRLLKKKLIYVQFSNIIYYLLFIIGFHMIIIVFQ